MVSIRVLSDLHLEFGPFEHHNVQADLTILAGDTYTKGRLWPSEYPINSIFKSPVLAIAGNHEFYGTSIDQGLLKLREDADKNNIIFLENQEFHIQNVRILGCTLWTDFRLHAGDNLNLAKLHASICVGDRYSKRQNDFHKIKIASSGYRKFTPLYATMKFAQSVSWLKSKLEEQHNGPTIVVTHHAPSARRLSPKDAVDIFDVPDASHLDSFIEEYQPDIWISGHIHEATDNFTIGKTKLISNPRGYTPNNFNKKFDPTFIINI